MNAITSFLNNLNVVVAGFTTISANKEKESLGHAYFFSPKVLAMLSLIFPKP